jgi:hypothetical protein
MEMDLVDFAFDEHDVILFLGGDVSPASWCLKTLIFVAIARGDE